MYLNHKILSWIFLVIFSIYFAGALQAELIFNFIDVGQGDSIFIETPCEMYVLIDAGENDHRGQRVVDYLKNRGIEKIDKVVATHQHADHIGGLVRIYQDEDLEVGVTYDSGYEYGSDLAETFRDKAEDHSEVKTPRAFDTISLECEDTIMTFIHPYEEADKDDEHYMNLVLKVEYNNFSAIFTGDAEEAAEDAMLDDEQTRSYLPSRLLKVGHHGSETSTSQDFLDEVSPEVAVIQAGKGHDHPRQLILDRLDDAGIKTMRTDKDGFIRVTTDGETYMVTRPYEPFLTESLQDGSRPEDWQDFEIDWREDFGDQYALFETEESYLKTPVMDLSKYNNIHLSFEVAKFGGGDDGPLTVEVSGDGGDTWDVQEFNSPVPPDASYLKSGPTLIETTGEEVQIRWTREESPSAKRLKNIVLSREVIIVDDISRLRNKKNDGKEYNLKGNAIITFMGSDPLQHWFIQDDTTGILVDNEAGIIQNDFEEKDKITNLIGTVIMNDNMVRFLPTQDEGEVVSYDNSVAPQTVTISDLEDDFAGERLLQSTLIRIENLDFAGENMTFASREGYVFQDEENKEIELFTYFSDLDYQGEPVPENTVHLIGVHGVANETLQIYTRKDDDIEDPSGVDDWFLY